MLKKQLLDEKYAGGGYRRKSLIWVGLGKGAVAFSLAATLAAVPAVAFADQNAAATDAAQTTTQEKVVPAKQDAADSNASAAAEPKSVAVAKIGDTSYASVQEAVKAAKAGDEIHLIADSNESVSVKTNVTFTADANVTFSGTITFYNGSQGSHVHGLHFQNDGVRDNINVTSGLAKAEPTVIENSFFTTPSTTSWPIEDQPSGVRISYSNNVEVKNNNFDLGRIKGQSNVAVNVVGPGPKDLTIEGNTLNVTAPAKDLTSYAGSVYLLIAVGGKESGVQHVTVSKNTFDDSKDAGNGDKRFAGISGVKNIFFTGNTVKNVSYGIAQAYWGGTTYKNTGVSIDSTNTFTNVNTPVGFETDDVASVRVNDTVTGYSTFEEAAAAAKNDESVVTLYGHVTNHPSVTFNKKVDIVGNAKAFNGSIRLNASNSSVSGVNFLIDGEDFKLTGPNKNGEYGVSGVLNSLVISNKAADVQVKGNKFTVKGDEGYDYKKHFNGKDVGPQPNAIWIEGAVKNPVIDGNEFELGSWSGSTVGVALTGWGATNQMTGVKITNNKGKLTGSAYGINGVNMFVKAFGAGDTSKGQYGIKGVEISNNVVTSEQKKKDAATGIGISNVTGLKVANNQISGVSRGVFTVKYRGDSDKSSDITIAGNTATDVDYVVNVDLAKPDDIKYGQGDANGAYNMIKASTLDTSKPAPVATGLAFAGWYTNGMKTYAENGDKNTLAKFVPVDANLIDYVGGSLRIDTDSAQKTSLRFGYYFDLAKVSKDAVLDENGGTGWTYTATINNRLVTDKLFPSKLKHDELSYTDPETSVSYKDRANLVLTNLPVALYDAPYSVTFTLGYSVHGVKASVSEPTSANSVKNVVNGIVNDKEARTDWVEYARSLDRAFKDATNESLIDTASAQQ